MSPVDFIKKPASGSLPFINVGSHPIADVLPALSRYAELLGADEILLHMVHDDTDEISTMGGMKQSYDLVTSPDIAVLKKKNVAVGMIVGLPVSRSLLDRAKSLEDAASKK